MKLWIARDKTQACTLSVFSGAMPVIEGVSWCERDDGTCEYVGEVGNEVAMGDFPLSGGQCIELVPAPAKED